MSDVFISHATSDDEKVNQIYDALTGAQISVWADHKDLRLPQANWRSSVQLALKNCRIGLLVLSRNSVSRSEIVSEWTYLLNIGKELVIVQIDDVPIEDIDYRLHIVQRINLVQNSHGFNEIIDNVKLYLHQGLSSIAPPKMSLSNIVTFKEHFDVVTSLAFCPASDHPMLASGSRDKTVRVWEIPTGKRLFKFQDHPSEIRSLAFSPKGSRLVSAAIDGSIRIRETLNEGRSQGGFSCINREKIELITTALAPNNVVLACGYSDGNIELWSISDSKQIQLLKGHKDKVLNLVFAHYNNLLASASDDGSIILWDLLDTNQFVALKGHEGAVTSVSFSPDNTIIASGSTDCSIRLWNTNNGEMLGAPFKGHHQAVTSVTFSPDGTLLASSSWDKTIKIWNVVSGVEMISHPAHDDAIAAVAFSPDGYEKLYLASASNDKTVKLWRVD